MKKIIALMMTAIIAVSLFGCGASEPEEEKSIFEIAEENKAKRESGK